MAKAVFEYPSPTWPTAAWPSSSSFPTPMSLALTWMDLVQKNNAAWTEASLKMIRTFAELSTMQSQILAPVMKSAEVVPLKAAAEAKAAAKEVVETVAEVVEAAPPAETDA